MKLNKQKIEELKIKIKTIKQKIASEQYVKVPKKYYALLILMLLLGVVTLSNNVKQYNKSKGEDYTEYTLEKEVEQEADTNNVEIVNFKTDQSSISTDVSNMEEEAIETISNNSEENKEEYIMPVKGSIIKEFAVEKLVYSETLGMWKTHPGIDIKAELGECVKSASDGTVQLVGQDSFYGNIIKILDSNGYTFVYSNLDSGIELKQGDKVNKGEIIGKVGVSATGELADETHLHFEILKNETQINPQDLITHE